MATTAHGRLNQMPQSSFQIFFRMCDMCANITFRNMKITDIFCSHLVCGNMKAKLYDLKTSLKKKINFKIVFNVFIVIATQGSQLHNLST